MTMNFLRFTFVTVDRAGIEPASDDDPRVLAVDLTIRPMRDQITPP